MLLLTSFVAALMPISLTTLKQHPVKDTSRPFPCQNRPCGCHTADQCKKKCCCFNDEQKLAWAKRHGVEASEVVDTTSKREASEVTSHAKCCSTHVASKSPSKNDDRISKKAGKSKSNRTIVIGVIAQECQGIVQTLMGQSIFVLPQIPTVKPLFGLTGERFILENSRLVQLFAEPPVPPPRLAAV